MSWNETNISRREILRALASISVLPVISLSACGEEKKETGVEQEKNNNSDDSTVSDDTGMPENVEEEIGWAAGGTAAMIAKSSYPNPFTEPSTLCELLATTTAGPCVVEEEFHRFGPSLSWG